MVNNKINGQNIIPKNIEGLKNLLLEILATPE